MSKRQSAIGKRLGKRGSAFPRPADACLETRGREILATIVNDEVADAMRLGIAGSKPDPADLTKKLDEPTSLKPRAGRDRK